jgi:hypothetical protein
MLFHMHQDNLSLTKKITHLIFWRCLGNEPFPRTSLRKTIYSFPVLRNHKPLEAPSHIHTKTLNRLQTALMDFDFEIQY